MPAPTSPGQQWPKKDYDHSHLRATLLVQGGHSACMGGTGRRLGENLQCFHAGYCMGQAASVLQPQIDISENVSSLADANLRGVSKVASSVATSGGSGGGNPCPLRRQRMFHPSS